MAHLTSNPSQYDQRVLTPPVQWLRWLLLRARGVLRTQAAGQHRLRRVETLSLGPRKSVYLLECDGERFLVADGLQAPVRVLNAQHAPGRDGDIS